MLLQVIPASTTGAGKMWWSTCLGILITLLTSQAHLTDHCVSLPPEACNSTLNNNTCRNVNGTGVCCFLYQEFILKEFFGGHHHVQSLYMYNVKLEEIDFNYVSWLNLESIAITDGMVQKINGLDYFHSIKCLNLSRNALTGGSEMNLTSLVHLQVLDLSQNNLTNLPILPWINMTDTSTLESLELWLDVSGNVRISCRDLQSLMLFTNTTKLEFQNGNSTYCSMSNSFSWFTLTEDIPLHHLQALVQVYKQCSDFEGEQNCRCVLNRFDFVPGRPMSVAFQVDCSNRNLDSLPSNLPPETTVLNVSHNNITDIDALSMEPYKGLREFHADYNLISSIAALEYTALINNFTILSLRSNNLKSIPTYFLTNAFDRTGGGRIMQLGGNKLHCDCNTAQDLKMWLVANKEHVPDYDDVDCGNLNKKVVDLDLQEVCVTQRVWTDYIYFIIGGEVTLLIFLVIKVSYDYWVFKTAGYLPWPASKLPKLPCDWVFET